MLDLGTMKIGVQVDDGKAKTELKGLGNEAEISSGKFGKLGQAGSALKGALTAIGFTVIAKEIIDLGKAALSAFADFEQLEGGIETLFSTASDAVMKNAQMAYATAGMSMNEYMSLATDFSAALVSDLDGDVEEAARITDMAIQDMSDNANKMGTDIQSIENAYQGFAKGNYTMLDNLKLGYGGTKSEMERLLADAEKLSGVHYDINNLDDVYEAIHVIQGEIGITGTTAEEASKTIQGSVAMAKASWQNLLIAFGTGENIDEAFDNFVNSVGTAASNVLPAIGRIAKNIVTAVVDRLPGFFREKVPQAINKILTILKDTVPQMVSKIGDMLKDLASVLSEPGTLRNFADKAGDIIKSLITGLIERFPDLVSGLWSLIKALPGLVVDSLGALVELGKDIVSAIWAGLKEIWGAVAGWFAEKIEQVKDWWNSILYPQSEPDIDINAADSVQKAQADYVAYRNGRLRESIEAGKAYANAKLTTNAAWNFHKVGIKEIPYDNYPAMLHKGEAVLTANEVNQYRRMLEQDGNKQNYTTVVSQGIDYRQLAKTLVDALQGMDSTTTVTIDGKAIAQTTAPYMKPVLNTLQNRADRRLGYV